MPPDILDMILEGQKQLKSDFAEHRRETNEKFEDLRHTLQGNGKPGVVNDLALLKEDQKRREWWSRTLSVLVIGQLVFLVGKAIAESIK